mgnify:CR=1 FL=1
MDLSIEDLMEDLMEGSMEDSMEGSIIQKLPNFNSELFKKERKLKVYTNSRKETKNIVSRSKLAELYGKSHTSALSDLSIF